MSKIYTLFEGKTAALVDIDGTLIDSTARHREAAGILYDNLKRAGTQPKEGDRQRFVDTLPHTPFPVFKEAMIGEISLPELHKAYGQAYQAATTQVTVFGGIPEAVGVFRTRDLTVAGVTGGIELVVRENTLLLQAAYKPHGQGCIFDALAYDIPGQPVKPNQEVLETLNAQLRENGKGRPPIVGEQSVVLGDSKADLLFARAIGAAFIYIHNNAPNEEIAQQSDASAKSIKEVSDQLN